MIDEGQIAGAAGTILEQFGVTSRKVGIVDDVRRLTDAATMSFAVIVRISVDERESSEVRWRQASRRAQ